MQAGRDTNGRPRGDSVGRRGQRREQFRSTKAGTLSRREQDAGHVHDATGDVPMESLNEEAKEPVGMALVIPRAAGTCRP
jgi:hypothetical protein